MKCPNNSCVWRSTVNGSCIAPIDERLRRHCPLPRDDAYMNDKEALEYIKARYPGQEEIWNDYLKRRETMKVVVKDNGSRDSTE